MNQMSGMSGLLKVHVLLVYTARFEEILKVEVHPDQVFPSLPHRKLQAAVHRQRYKRNDRNFPCS